MHCDTVASSRDFHDRYFPNVKLMIYLYVFFLKLYAFILLTSTLVPGINYFVVTTHPLHQLQVRKRSSSSCYMIETYNTRHRFPCY